MKLNKKQIKILVDKTLIANNFSDPIKLVHLKEYEKEFCQLFEELTKKYKQLPPKH